MTYHKENKPRSEREPIKAQGTDMSPKKEAKKDEQVKAELQRKVEELEKSLKEAEDKTQRYQDQLKYAKADLDNIQKQNQRRLTDTLEKANGELLQLLLPLNDELEILATRDAEKEKLEEGVRMVQRKMAKLLESAGVQPIEALGHPFDPFRHEAIAEEETLEEPEGYVVEEVRRGYMFKERLLRASVVKVAKNPAEPDKIEEDQDE
jgi:molecular chaperone GrpE